MPKYNVDKTFWRHGVEVNAGETIVMTKAEAKYLGHVVSEDKLKTDPPAPAAKAQAPAKPAHAAPLAAEVSEVKKTATPAKSNA